MQLVCLLDSCYREAYGIFACNGILFNHESPGKLLCGKITRGL